MDAEALVRQIKLLYMRRSSGPLKSRLWGAVERALSGGLRELQRRGAKEYYCTVGGVADTDGRLEVASNRQMTRIEGDWLAAVLRGRTMPDDRLSTYIVVEKLRGHPIRLSVTGRRSSPGELIMWHNDELDRPRSSGSPAGMRGEREMSAEERREVMARLSTLSGRSETATVDDPDDEE